MDITLLDISAGALTFHHQHNACNEHKLTVIKPDSKDYERLMLHDYLHFFFYIGADTELAEGDLISLIENRLNSCNTTYPELSCFTDTLPPGFLELWLKYN
jgi:hypothetical protein